MCATNGDITRWIVSRKTINEVFLLGESGG